MNRKKTRVAILISDKIDFKTKVMKGDTEGHFIILKRRIHQEDINIINIYAPNIGANKYIRKILEDFKKDIDSNTLILGDFNTPLSTMDGSSKQDINKDTVALNNALDQMDLTDIYIEPIIPKKQNTHSFCLLLSGKLLICPNILIEILAGWSSLVCRPLLFHYLEYFLPFPSGL